MLLWGLAGVGGAKKGSVSRRYMRIKPKIRDNPIQAWGSRSGFDLVESGGVVEAVLWGDEVEVFKSSLSSNMLILPGSVGVFGGGDCGVSPFTSSVVGETGPGIALRSLAFPFSSRSVIQDTRGAILRSGLIGSNNSLDLKMASFGVELLRV